MRAIGAIVIGMLAVAALAVQPEATPAPAVQQLLRVCADPNNLPFSNAGGEGFENKLAEMLARDVGARLEYTWWAQRRGFLRSTLGERRCDVIMGYPSSADGVATTAPYYRSTYVFVTRRGRARVRSFDDGALRRLRIGVQLIGDDGANSPPVHALSRRGVVGNLVGYPVYGDYRSNSPPSAIIAAVARGDVDVAAAWGPLAGYFAALQSPPLDIVPVSPALDGPTLPQVFDISIAVRRGEPDRLARLNQFIADHRREIDALLRAYHVPRVEGGGR